jgi:hypothetical protein
MLAALGLLRLADRCDPGARMGWHMESGHWSPVLELKLEHDFFIDQCVSWVNELAKTKSASPLLNRETNAVKTKLKKANLELKEQRKKAKSAVKTKKLKGDDAKIFIAEMVSSYEDCVYQLEVEFQDLNIKLSESIGRGIAHYGDTIGVSSIVVRRAATESVLGFIDKKGDGEFSAEDNQLVLAQLSALACDQVYNGGNVSPTRFSFSNGAGGQSLLKDFRSLAKDMDTTCLTSTIYGLPDRFVMGRTNLNWDPNDNRSYALGWWSPENKKNNPKKTDLAANALAYLGLSFMTAVPLYGRIKSIGWGPGDEWTWPIWGPMLNSQVVGSLLAHPILFEKTPQVEVFSKIGIVELRRSVRYDPTGQGRPYFAMSKPL